MFCWHLTTYSSGQNYRRFFPGILLTVGQKLLHLGVIFCMYILKISRKLVSKGICNQSIFEFTRVISPNHDFETFDQFCEENGFTKIFNFLHEFYFGFQEAILERKLTSVIICSHWRSISVFVAEGGNGLKKSII